jgi:hypothetical protein
MTNSNNINETKFLSEAIIKGYSKPISKKWDANHFNDTHIHDVDLFLYVEQGELVVGVEHNNGLNATTLAHDDSIEVLAGEMHYKSV